MLIILVSTVFFAISCMTYFGMFIYLKNQVTTVQNVTVTSEGPIREVVNKLYTLKCGSEWGSSTVNEKYLFFLSY